jgi:hypothetical protein
VAREPVEVNTPASELVGVLGAALESAAVGQGEGTVADAAAAAGVVSAIEEGVGVAWAPPDERSTAPAPTSRRRTKMPNPRKRGTALRLAGVGA